MAADETRLHIHGENGWPWVYEHLAAAVYPIAPTRRHDAPLEVLEGYEGTLVRDAWDPHDATTTADHPLDPDHVHR